MGDKHKDMECAVPIRKEEALMIEGVFSLMIESFKAGYEPWIVLDGYECTVICGRQRIRFDGPCYHTPFAAFTNFASRLIKVMEHWDKSLFEETLMLIPEVLARLEKQNELKV